MEALGVLTCAVVYLERDLSKVCANNSWQLFDASVSRASSFKESI
jgi:hypothetical protein